MGKYVFSYKIPDNFTKRVVQYLNQFGQIQQAEAFKRCKYEYSDQGLAHYAEMKGTAWNQKAVDFSIEGHQKDITILQLADSKLKIAIGKALNPSESGYLIRELFFLDSDVDCDSTIDLLSDGDRLNHDIQLANMVLEDILQIGERLCLNSLYNKSSLEDNINDFFRDMLFSKGYNEVKDQTRHGISINGKEAAEVDILLTKDGKEIALFEGLKLDYVNKSYIDKHIKKSIINYNALGTATFIVAYVISSDFESFITRYYDYLRKYEFPLLVKKPFNQSINPNAVTRVASLVLSKDGYDFPLYFVTLKIG